MRGFRSLPTALLRVAGILLYRIGLARLVIRLRQNAPRVIAYHACEPSESAFTRGLDCNTPPALLAKHLAFFATHYEVVPLATIVHGAPARALAITFDDAYHSVYEHALPILREHHCAATVFVVTDAIAEKTLTWVNELTWLLNTGGDAARRMATKVLGVPGDSTLEVIVARARERYGGECRAVLDEVATAAGIEPPRDSHLYMGWTEARAATEAGVSFGNHTATHPDLGQLDAIAQHQEIARARRAIETHLPPAAVLSALAYPFGSSNRHTREAAVSAGVPILLGIGGATADYGDCVLLARTPVGAVTVPQLFADLEIVEPAKAAIRRLLSRLASQLLMGGGDWHSRADGRRVPGAPQV